ncbi:MAG: NADH-quinone oxidoreductase subunit NuoE [Legionellaceae bacterium]|nr:NADH-quinone oxidoreductase subunit NuoE [Legionellaceae bacterium]
MSQEIAQTLPQMVSAERLQEIDTWIQKYPVEERQSAVMSTLRIVQEEKGFLTTESMDAIADYLQMPRIAVYEVASFYTMYEPAPIGRHLINVCTNISCKLCDSSSIISALERKLGVRLGETTADGRFTLRAVECLGACVGAPMMQINKEYHEHLTPESLEVILEQYV